ncbi:MAG TPA: hypothetical protein VK308_06515 [Pyrinomonadaceae bacterium]|nr:hypothetical protein [Pyrinomonadaceae bacterium]
MKTKEFNENYEIDRKAKGIKALPKSASAEAVTIRTADGENYDSNETYYFFDSQIAQVRTSAGLRRAGEHLCNFGLNVIAVSKLRANRDAALTDGQNFFKSEVERLQNRIQKFEMEKTGEKRKLKDFSLLTS